MLDLLSLDGRGTKASEHPHIAWALLGLARTEAAVGNLAAAHEHCQQSGRAFKATQGMASVPYAHALLVLGSIRAMRGDRADGMRLAEQAVAVFGAAGVRLREAQGLRLSSAIESMGARFTEAKRLLGLAEEIAQKANARIPGEVQLERAVLSTTLGLWRDADGQLQALLTQLHNPSEAIMLVPACLAEAAYLDTLCSRFASAAECVASAMDRLGSARTPLRARVFSVQVR
jgi:hypothetical protein